MKLSPRIEKMMRDPESQIHTVELTEEYKQRLNKICGEVLDELVKRTHGPAEAYMVLQVVTSSLEESQGIKGGFTVEHREEKQ